MRDPYAMIDADTSRPARGAWIEIFCIQAWAKFRIGRAPQGARGLKFINQLKQEGIDTSRPARGAWIEIPVGSALVTAVSVAPRKGRVD